MEAEIDNISLRSVFSTGAMGALAPAILGQIVAVSTHNSKVLNTPLINSLPPTVL